MNPRGAQALKSQAATRWIQGHIPVLGLGAKVALAVGIGTLSMIGLFAYMGTTSLAENTERTLQERVVLAQMTASYIDALLENSESVLTHEAGDEGWEDPSRSERMLEQVYHRLNFFASRVFLVDASGRVLAAQPTITETLDLSEIAPVQAALSGTRFAISPVANPLGSLGPSVVAAAPIRDTAGKINRALAITLAFTNPSIRALSNPIGLGETGYMDLVALDGQILASTRPGRAGAESDHGATLRGLIRDHRQTVSACHDCHTSVAESEPRSEVLAFAPLERAQWGIAVRQSESEVFAPTRLLQSRILELMILMLSGALVLVYMATHSVIVPVRVLTAATRRIAAGDLDTPIRVQSRDEVGVLAQSLDEMRARLKQSGEEIQRWNRELDGRVRERTLAYEAKAEENARLYAELRQKEQLRSDLLRRVISAQEDERIRIARELHDETSQGLTALMVGLDSAVLASAHDIGKATAHMRGCKALAETLLKNIHRLITDLRPSLLDDLGLVPAITGYVKERLNPSGVGFRIQEEGLKTRLPPSIETALFRITQEAITNIVRHARAAFVLVHLTRKGDQVTLQISDNGVGFDVQALQATDPHGQGLGLRGMQERAAILGGEFQLVSLPGTGTTITVCLVLPHV